MPSVVLRPPGGQDGSRGAALVAIAVNRWNTYTRKPAFAEAGIIPPRAKDAKPWQGEAAPKDGFHVPRHICAPIMLEAGSPW
jgi:hypothetical protein